MSTKQQLQDCRETFDETVERLKRENAELLAACKGAERALQCSIGQENLADHFPLKLDMLRKAIARAEGGRNG